MQRFRGSTRGGGGRAESETSRSDRAPSSSAGGAGELRLPGADSQQDIEFVLISKQFQSGDSAPPSRLLLERQRLVMERLKVRTIFSSKMFSRMQKK